MKNRMLKRICRVLQDERGSVYMEYGMVAGFLLLAGIAVFEPEGPVWKTLGWDMEFRYILFRLPLF